MGNAPKNPDDNPDEEDPLDRIFAQGDAAARRVRGVLIKVTPAPLRRSWRRLMVMINRQMPKGLLGRSTLIIVVPMLILQAVLAVVFMERHRTLVTTQLSAGVVRQLSMLVYSIEQLPATTDPAALISVAEKNLGLEIILEPGAGRAILPVTSDFVETTLRTAIARIINRPTDVDVMRDPELVTIDLETSRGLLTVTADRGRVYAANWHIFMVWMVGASLVLIGLSVVFIRNQIRPIRRLADAAEAFGKGQADSDFRPGGAREVRRAAVAFIEMRSRIERQIEQRTAMLAGVSHDLRTVLTRFRLELAMLSDADEAAAMARDVDEMEAMLEAYLAFAKGDGDEAAVETNIEELLEDLSARAWGPAALSMQFTGASLITLRPNAIRRLLTNLIANAARFGDKVEVRARHGEGWLTLSVDDNGPGIPENEREAVFRPFYRLDQARNQDHGGTGLGLAIARDIARSHGGEIRLEVSPLGGLRVGVRLPG